MGQITETQLKTWSTANYDTTRYLQYSWFEVPVPAFIDADCVQASLNLPIQFISKRESINFIFSRDTQDPQLISH